MSKFEKKFALVESNPMELNASVTLYPDGRYELYLEEEKGSGFMVSVSEEDLKRLALAYAEAQKKKKEQLAKDVEKSKGLTKKALVKAFLMKVVRKRMAGKTNLRVLKQTIFAGKKALTQHIRAISNADADADAFWRLVEKELPSGVASSEPYKFIRDWFFDVLSHEVSAGHATDYSQAPKDYIDDVLLPIHKAATTSSGKMVKVWDQDVQPPYSSRLSLEQMEEFKELFPQMEVEDEIDFQGDEDEEDVPYNYKIFVKFPKKKRD